MIPFLYQSDYVTNNGMVNTCSFTNFEIHTTSGAYTGSVIAIDNSGKLDVDARVLGTTNIRVSFDYANIGYSTVYFDVKVECKALSINAVVSDVSKEVPSVQQAGKVVIKQKSDIVNIQSDESVCPLVILATDASTGASILTSSTWVSLSS